MINGKTVLSSFEKTNYNVNLRHSESVTQNVLETK
jgi:hypothetical protein